MSRQSASGRGWGAWLGAAALGAITMYFSDPDRGRRRRALLRDRMRHAGIAAGRAANAAQRDFSNRMEGVRARTRNLMSRQGAHATIDDDVLVARVRSRLGRVASHPGSVHVEARQGLVTLSGPVLGQEREQMLHSVRAVPGVAGIEDALQVHDSPQHVPGLQGEGHPASNRSSSRRTQWPPAMRGAAVLGAGALGGYGLLRRKPIGLAMAAFGATLLARGLSGRSMQRMTGAGSHAIEVEKSIDIMAAPETVFDAWSRYENFPHFMSHVLEVRDLGQQRSHWTVQGPAGTQVEWNARLIECRRPVSLAWKSEAGASVPNAGTVRLAPNDNGGTRVTVRLSYSPPAGTVGHQIASLLGSDPGSRLEDDLARMKAFLESGVRPVDAARPAARPSRELH